jgi:hypothetical protein
LGAVCCVRSCASQRAQTSQTKPTKLHESSAVWKSKRKDQAPQRLFWIHFELLLALRLVHALYSSAAGRQNSLSGLISGDAAISATRTRAPLCRLKWRCSAISISISHLRRPMQCKISAIRDPIQPHLHQSKALSELSRYQTFLLHSVQRRFSALVSRSAEWEGAGPSGERTGEAPIANRGDAEGLKKAGSAA